MASQFLTLSNVFPDGTSVSAYLAREQVDSGQAPLGTAVNTQTVANGTVTFTGLTLGESYEAIGQVAGVWTRRAFAVDDVAHTAVFTDEDVTFTGDVDFDGDVTLPELDDHTADTTGVHGISNTADIAVIRASPLNAKLAEYAVPIDGTTDATTAFGTVRDAAGVGGHVYVPPGTYILNNLILSVASQRWELAPGAILKLKDSSTNGALIQIQGANVVIDGGAIDGNRANNSGISDTSGVLQVRTSGARISNVYIHDTRGYGILGNTLGAGLETSNVEVRGCTFIDTRSAAVTFNFGTPTIPSRGIRIVSCFADNSALGAADVIASGFAATCGSGTTEANYARDILVADCYTKSRVDATGNSCGVEVVRCRGVKMKDCYAEFTKFAGFSFGGSCIDSTITGCTSYGSANYGVELIGYNLAASNCVVDGNATALCGFGINGVEDVSVTGCVVTNMTVSGTTEAGGVFLVPTGGRDIRAVITGNEFHCERGVYVNGDYYDVLVADNLLAADTAASGRYGIVAIPTLGDAKRWVFRGNEILDGDSAAVRIQAAAGITLSKVQIRGNAYFDCSSPAISLSNITLDTSCIAEDLLTGSVASAATVTLPFSDLVTITGTTNITSLTASWPGRRVTLVFAGILTFTDGSNLKLAGNFVTTADDSITLVSDGTNWVETGRSVN